MKRFNTLLLVLLFPLALMAQTGGDFTLKGTIKGLKKGTLQMTLLPPSNAEVGTCEVTNETFLLKGNIKEPQKVFLFINDDKGDVYTAFGMFIESGDLEVFYTPERKYKPDYPKAPFQQEMMAYEQYMRTLPESSKIDDLRVTISEALKKGNSAVVEQSEKEKKRLTWSLINKLMTNKPDANKSQAVAYLVTRLGYSLPLEDQPKIVNLFVPELKTKAFYLKEFIENYEKEIQLGIGKVAPNFTLEDLAGKKYSLSDFKGKYVFVQFSASWCGWCKKEIPYILSAKEKLEGKDVVFITINMDKKRSLWENDVKKENISWLCLSNLEGMDSQLAKDYNVNSIPASFVVSPEGKITERNLRGDAVYQYLNSVVK